MYELTAPSAAAKVGADKVTVHITADDMGPKIEETVRMILDAHSHEVNTLREQWFDHMQDRLNKQGAQIRHLEHQMREVRDGLDAWAGRIQRLESLPGVQEALAAQEREGK